MAWDVAYRMIQIYLLVQLKSKNSFYIVQIDKHVGDIGFSIIFNG